MLDIGWLELLVIGIVALIVVGPKDLPVMFRNMGRFMGKMRGMAREFQRSMEEAADQTGLKQAAADLNKMRDMGLKSPTKSARAYADSLLKDDDGKKKPAAAPDSAEARAQAEDDKAEAAADLAEAAADTPMPDADVPRSQPEKRAEAANEPKSES